MIQKAARMGDSWKDLIDLTANLAQLGTLVGIVLGGIVRFRRRAHTRNTTDGRDEHDD